MRVLIVGAGIAGLTLAASLRQRGVDPVVVDQRVNGADLGYALALWPHGSRVLHDLGSHDEFVSLSEEMRSYVAYDGSGAVLTSSPLPQSISSHGHLGIIPRSDLTALLRRTLEPVGVRDGVSVDTLSQDGDLVSVEFNDGTSGTFDLVVGADGVQSKVRRLLFGPVTGFDSGWGCFVWWGDPRTGKPGQTTEHWGAGGFLGTYPCRSRLCVIVGGPKDVLMPDQTEGRAGRITDLLRGLGAQNDAYLEGLPVDTEQLFWWPMSDIRAPRWVDGRVVLLGDAATSFLPTAGIGASMAMESAAVLSDELSRTDSTYLPDALALYERRRRRRVLAAQSQSRRLARISFVRSPAIATLRNQALRRTSMESMVGSLIKGLRHPI